MPGGRDRDLSLRPLFEPRSIAVIGASDDPARIGGRPFRYLREAGYRGPVYPVNPGRETVQGARAYPAITDVPELVDVAIVAVPAAAAVDAVRACAEAGTGAAVIFTAGFAEIGGEGVERQRELSEIARSSGLRILGPNCLGAMNIAQRFVGTFSASLDSGPGFEGRIAFVSQSGAFGSHCFAAARERGLGFSHWVTTGNEVDIDVADCLGYLAESPDCEILLAYLEGCRDGRRLEESLAAARERDKPVVVLKVGASEAGARAVASHTASLVGPDAAYDAVFRRHGAHRAHTVAELLDVAEACAHGVYPRGPRTGLVTVSGGIGVLMADAATGAGLDVHPMPEDAQETLRSLWPYAGVGNPVDTTAQTINDPDLFGKFLTTMLEAGAFDSIVAFLAHVGLDAERAEPMLHALVAAQERHPEQLVAVSMLTRPEVRRRFTEHGCLVIEDPTAAVHAAAALQRMRARRDAPRELWTPGRALPAPPSGAVDELAAKRLLAAAGVPVPAERVVGSADAAVTAASEIGGPVVLKVASPAITHKTDVGGVLLGLTTPAEVREGFAVLLDRAATAVPGAERDGVLVAPQVKGGVETIVGVHDDPVFGPLVAFGLGGTAVEVLDDVAVRLAPFGPEEARGMIEEIQGYPLLSGARGEPAADLDALARVVATLSHLAVAWSGQVDGFDVNPLLVRPAGEGTVALDALIVPVTPPGRPPRTGGARSRRPS